MVTISLALSLISSHNQGDFFDGDMKIFSVDYSNAEINRVIRAIFQSRSLKYGVESGIQGSVELHMKEIPLLIVLKKSLDQVKASAYENSHHIYVVEDMPDHPSEWDVLNRKLPAYDFKKVALNYAIDSIFADARLRYRHPKIDSKNVGMSLREGTLKQALEVLLPLAKCTANYTHGHFDLLPDSEEKPIREVLDKPVHNIDFINIGATNAFATLFKQSGAEYVLGPNIDRRLTLNLRDAKFGDALDVLCQLTDTTYQLRGTVYQITRRSFE